MRLHWMVGCLFVVALGVMCWQPAAAFDDGAHSPSATEDTVKAEHGGVMVAQLMEQLGDVLNPDERAEPEPRHDPGYRHEPGRDYDRHGHDGRYNEHREHMHDDMGRHNHGRVYGYDDEQLRCYSGEIAYRGGCIEEPRGEGEPMYSGGECPEGYFAYEGRCHVRPREEDIRREPRDYGDEHESMRHEHRDHDEQARPGHKEENRPQCQTAYNACIQQCEAHRGNQSAYNQCMDNCNTGFNTCMQQ